MTVSNGGASDGTCDRGGPRAAPNERHDLFKYFDGTGGVFDVRSPGSHRISRVRDRRWPSAGSVTGREFGKKRKG
jgi:hypothetical protein